MPRYMINFNEPKKFRGYTVYKTQDSIKGCPGPQITLDAIIDDNSVISSDSFIVGKVNIRESTITSSTIRNTSQYDVEIMDSLIVRSEVVSTDCCGTTIIGSDISDTCIVDGYIKFSEIIDNSFINCNFDHVAINSVYGLNIRDVSADNITISGNVSDFEIIDVIVNGELFKVVVFLFENNYSIMIKMFETNYDYRTIFRSQGMIYEDKEKRVKADYVSRTIQECLTALYKRNPPNNDRQKTEREVLLKEGIDELCFY